MSFSQRHRPDRVQQGSLLFANPSVEEHATSPALTPGSDVPDKLRPTYTTAGTLYNPGTATPIQAPIRRGRNNRWQPSHVSELAGLPKSILANLPLNMHRTRSPATTASSLKHYAPLQQNYDRAMTPPAKEDGYFESADMEIAALSAPSSIPHDQDRLSQPRLSATHSTGTSRAVSQNSNKEDKEDSEDSDSMVDAAADALAARLNFKSLTSLASYENPSQQIAKRALARGRNSLKYPDLPVHGTANTALQSPSFHQQGRQQPPSLSQSSLSATRADRQFAGSTKSPKALWPVNETLLNQNISQLSLNRGPKALVSAIDTAYPSALSTGPGAPLPLTAGPPGLRQYRPSSFETNAPAASGGSKLPNRVYEAENEQRKRNESPLLTLREAREQDLSHVPYMDENSLPDQVDSEPATRDRLEPANSDFGLLARSTLPSSLVYETESPDKIDQYYPDQFPPDYTPSKKSDFQTSDWEAECVARRRFPGRRTAEQLARHQKKVDESWYAGISRIHETMDDAIAQMQTRQLLHTIGRPEHADAFSMNGSTDNVSHSIGRELSLQDAIRTDRPRHAAPLLNMAFSTLLSYVDECGANKQRSPFMDYREWRDMKTAERHRAWSTENLQW
ncbi:hypothetical protein MGG_02631 [Pyricularia oryzae 70-15]|uniref:Uncharacterized protein n=3 Tax=Pyricularia oryzae TaxID=318829 RepID=G4NJJ6_PYRO7|nr:uncharacterized protein MGG_02631 [Pyricularia oryzae 70-15]EHA46415.1 hypothetical protein MGG_02631 [Pyricularia oryzae 70-15]ELQ36320.1 hypothetical protein OOU_Y34scaffold00666g181 [Pyricularia oryzae Y34]KAI7929975.1 hypothetical protein M9X92_001093 [Pyricularia oryzae]KAI7930460.1 hypothetical protein M0657_001580 [Pyricularia oryzae]